MKVDGELDRKNKAGPTEKGKLSSKCERFDEIAD